MKTQALVPALALTAALLASPPAEADGRHRSERGGRAPAHGYYDGRPSRGSYGYGSRYGRGYGYRSGPGYRNRSGDYGYGNYGYGYRPVRPYYRSPRYCAPPPVYYGYGYGGYDAYDYEYDPPPPPRYYRPRVGVGIWFGF